MSVFQATNEGRVAIGLGLTTTVIKYKKGCLKPLVAESVSLNISDQER